MGLIIASKLEVRMYLIEKGKHVGIFIPLPKRFLSEPYNLESFKYYIVEGELLDIEILEKSIDEKLIERVQNELKGKKLTFYLRVEFGKIDSLYLSEDSWKIIRDYGILPGNAKLKVKLTSIEIDGKKEEIYPKRDIIVPEIEIDLAKFV